MPPHDHHDSNEDQPEQPFARWMRGEGPPRWGPNKEAPFWMGGEGPARWKHGEEAPWKRHRRQRGRRIFLLFVAVFGVIALLMFGLMALLAWLATQLFGGDGQVTAAVWLVSCGLVIALPLLAAGIAARAFRSIARPLGDVMEAADAVAEGDLSARVPERGSREFRQLARSFNRMASELEMSDQQRRNLMADVAHELRTPLHIIQGNLEGVLDGVYQATPDHIEATLDETRLLARLVEDLRVLSLAEAGHLPMVMGPVDVGELLEDAATSFSGQAEAAGVRLTVALPDQRDDLIVTGDAGRLDQVIGNLVANALRHTPRDGTVTLHAETRPDSVQITVSDTGQGIAPEELPHIFDRFWSRSEGSGSGLGLAIARSLVQAHGGQIAASSEIGLGTTIVVVLPNRPVTLPA
ncbi:MAG: ATP-binding protein [Caldilineales bacterium]